MTRLTRGYGILENFLAVKRAKKAQSLLAGKHGRILDIGCGNYPYFLVEARGFGEKYALDKFTNKSQPAEFKNLGIEAWQFDIEGGKFPFSDNYFDAVTMLAVLEHIERTKLQTCFR